MSEKTNLNIIDLISPTLLHFFKENLKACHLYTYSLQYVHHFFHADCFTYKIRPKKKNKLAALMLDLTNDANYWKAVKAGVYSISILHVQ